MSGATARVGLLTIGQSPRPDLCEAIVQSLPAGVVPLQAGLLDGLDDAAIAADFAPREGEDRLLTRLADGRTVALGAAAVEGRMQQAVDALEARGVAAIVVLCTGSFAQLRTRHALLVEPDGLLGGTVRGLLRGELLGLVAPLAEQLPMVRAKWRGLARAPACEAASPYGEEAAVVAAAQRLASAGVRMIVLDCMGYGERHRRALRAAGIAVPVLSSAGIVAAALAPLLG